MVTRRSLLVLSLALPGLPAFGFTPSASDRADIARIEAYLTGLRSLKARFLQVAPDGGISGGSAWVVRPGRLRFEYDPPSPFLLVAGQTGLIFHDSSLRQTSHIPLSRTPLGILLADQAKLSGEVTILGLERLPGQIDVRLTRTGAEGDGSLILTFADNPLTLRQWRVIDGQRRETRVTLSNLELGGSFDPKLFDFKGDAPLPGSAGGG
jgi:outer membrane lipoprotein-sorting protein